MSPRGTIVHVSVDSFVRIVEAVAALFSSLAWPLTALVAARWLAPHLVRLLDREKVSLVAPGGFGISAEKLTSDDQAVVTQALVAASASSGTPVSQQAASSAVAEVVSDVRLPRVRGARVLWVDDHPENNLEEQRALEKFGIRFDHAFTTPEALVLLATSAYELVVSDLGRVVDGLENDADAGITLISEMRRRRILTPVVVYAGRRGVERRRDIKAAGAIDAVGSATELFDVVLQTLLAR